MNASTESVPTVDSEGLYQLLRKSALAEGLSDEHCRALSQIVEVRELNDRETLISEGYTDACLYLITKGRLEVTRNVSGGQWITLAVLEENDFAGEMGFIDGTPHSATLRALGAAQVFSLPKAAFESLIDTDPHLVYKLMQTIVRAVHKILTRMNQQFVEMNNYISKQHGRY
jgi:CRP-like cAMP-binding protein